MKVVAFLPAKGSSSRVANKNTRVFNGEPFFAFTLKKLLRCDFIDEVFIDSEDQEILKVGSRLGATPLPRDPQLASNATDGNRLFYNEAAQVEADIYIQALCTSPFVRPDTIKRAVQMLKDDPSIDSVVLGRREKVYLWDNGVPTYDVANVPNSVDLPDQISESMSLYVIRAEAAHRTRRRIGDRPALIFGDPIENIDVNTPAEFELAERVAQGLLAEDNRKLRLLETVLSSPILSDVCDEFGLETVLSNAFRCNLGNQRILARARTLEIAESTPEDDPSGIYRALQSYKLMAADDIIVVKNNVPNFAYFGELNTKLAIRSGARAAIIDGVTRDSSSTISANFPVFAKGLYCRDIKGRGTVKSMNEPITIDGVRIDPSALIFADQDGIVVIPPAYEAQIMQAAVEKLSAESGVHSDILADFDVDSLVQRNGFF